MTSDDRLRSRIRALVACWWIHRRKKDARERLVAAIVVEIEKQLADARAQLEEGRG